MTQSEIPNDADGMAIKRVRDSGSNLEVEMDIDIQIVAPTEREVEIVEERLLIAGFKVRRFFHEETDDWDVIGTKNMILTYNAVVELQKSTEDLLSDVDCSVDGWGTAGNAA